MRRPFGGAIIQAMSSSLLRITGRDRAGARGRGRTWPLGAAAAPLALLTTLLAGAAAASAATPTPFDGRWTVTLTCPPHDGDEEGSAKGYTHTFPVEVAGGPHCGPAQTYARGASPLTIARSALGRAVRGASGARTVSTFRGRYEARAV